MNLKTISGNQATYPGTLHAAVLELAASTATRLSTATNLCTAADLDTLVASLPETTHVAFRWAGAGELSIKPQIQNGTTANWPTLLAAAEGIWPLDTFRTLTVVNQGATARLHLIFLRGGET